jgi:hypothetical protein
MSFIYVSYTTDAFKIGFFDRKRTNTGNCSESIKFYEKRSAGGKRG